MSLKVWQVFEHGVTTGRDSGWPTKTSVGPLFATRADAQAEADRMLVLLPVRHRTSSVQTTSGYDAPWVDVPTYETWSVLVLDRVVAQDRQQQFRVERQHIRVQRAALLEAEATALRSGDE